MVVYGMSEFSSSYWARCIRVW